MGLPSGGHVEVGLRSGSRLVRADLVIMGVVMIPVSDVPTEGHPYEWCDGQKRGLDRDTNAVSQS